MDQVPLLATNFLWHLGPAPLSYGELQWQGFSVRQISPVECSGQEPACWHSCTASAFRSGFGVTALICIPQSLLALDTSIASISVCAWLGNNSDPMPTSACLEVHKQKGMNWFNSTRKTEIHTANRMGKTQVRMQWVSYTLALPWSTEVLISYMWQHIEDTFLQVQACFPHWTVNTAEEVDDYRLTCECIYSTSNKHIST